MKNVQLNNESQMNDFFHNNKNVQNIKMFANFQAFCSGAMFKYSKKVWSQSSYIKLLNGKKSVQYSKKKIKRQKLKSVWQKMAIRAALWVQDTQF